MKRILIVDDERDVCHAIKTRLERQEGYQVAVAGDGQEALLRLKEETPDLIILDLMMPKMGGEEFLKSIRGDQRTSGIPVLISTVRREASFLYHLTNLGATGYLMKPYEATELIDLIKSYI